MFVSITLLISTLFFQIILIQFLTNQTLTKYKRLEIKKEMKTESLKILKEIYKIENSMTNLSYDNINSTIAILEKKCMSEYSKMNKCLIMNMQGTVITNNGTNTYCNAFLGFMNKIHPNKKVLKTDIKEILMSYNGSVNLPAVPPAISVNETIDINISPNDIKAYGSYVNYLNDNNVFTAAKITSAMNNANYTADNFIEYTKIAQYTRLKQMLPKTKTTDYKNITFYSLFSISYEDNTHPIFFQDLRFPMYSNYSSKKNIAFNNNAEFLYGVESYLHMTIPKLKSISKILDNLKHGLYKKLSKEIDNNNFKTNDYNENQNTYATAYFRFKNTIKALGYSDEAKLFNDYEKAPDTLAKSIMSTATASGKINFHLLRYHLYYYNYFDSAGVKVDFSNIDLCDYTQYIIPVLYKYRTSF